MFMVAPQREQLVLQHVAVPLEEGVELAGRPGRNLGSLRPDLRAGRRVDGALLPGRVHGDLAVVQGRIEDGPENNVHLVNGVGRQRLPVAALVPATGLLQLAVVAADPRGGEPVEGDVSELGG